MLNVVILEGENGDVVASALLEPASTKATTSATSDIAGIVQFDGGIRLHHTHQTAAAGPPTVPGMPLGVRAANLLKLPHEPRHRGHQAGEEKVEVVEVHVHVPQRERHTIMP